MAELTFNPFVKEEADKIFNMLSVLRGSAPAAAAADSAVAADKNASDASATAAKNAADSAAAVAKNAPVAPATDVPTDAELQKVVQSVVTLGATKGVGVPQVLGVLKTLGVNRISELGQEARIEFKRLAEALVA